MSESATQLNSLEIGERLKEARNSLGLSQQVLAEKIESSKTGIQANEAGRSVPGGAVLLGFIGLGISADWILSGVGSMHINDRISAPIQGIPGDLKLFAEAMEIIDMYIQKTGKHLSPEKKRKAVETLYKLSENKAVIDPSVTEMIMQLAA